ncbi:hypothetical protein YC2023_061254 [Brassica napus]
MVNSSIILADLKAGSCSNTVKVRLIRFGEARIVKNGGHLRGVHMLLLNEKVGCMVLMSLEARFTTKVYRGHGKSDHPSREVSFSKV